MQVVHIQEEPKSLLLNLFLTLIMGLALLYFGAIGFVFETRKKIFNREFMDQFNEEHCKHFPEAQQAPSMGYPDTGCGRYAAKLTYSDWLDMNNAQRVHINYFEMITFTLVVSLVAFSGYPKVTVAALGAHLVGRVVYSIGYSRYGPFYRAPGAITMLVANSVLLMTAGCSVANLMGY